MCCHNDGRWDPPKLDSFPTACRSSSLMVASIMLGQSNFPIDSYPILGSRETPVAALCSSSSKKRRRSQPLIMRSFVAGPLLGPSAGTNDGYHRRGHMQPQALGAGDKLLVRPLCRPGLRRLVPEPWGACCNGPNLVSEGEAQISNGSTANKGRGKAPGGNVSSSTHPQGDSVHRQVVFVCVWWGRTSL